MKPNVRKGATPYKGGCAFAVWALHAAEVFIVGTFNDWDNTAHPMTRNPDGVWSGDVPGTKAGDEYHYRIVTGDHEHSRIDPYARHVTNSVGNAIIKLRYRRGKSEPFSPSLLNNLGICELHIGTFGKQEGRGGSGPLEGAIARLSYLRDLGINAVEVMPLAEFAGESSWGCNPSHIFAVASDTEHHVRSESWWMMRTDSALPLSWMWSTTILVRVTLICGNLTAGTRMERAVSTFIMISVRKHNQRRSVNVVPLKLQQSYRL